MPFSIDTITGKAFNKDEYSVEEMMALDAKVSTYFLYFHSITDAQVKINDKWLPAIVYVSGTHRYIRYRIAGNGENASVSTEQFYTYPVSDFETVNFAKEKFEVETNAAARTLKAGGVEILCPRSRDFNIAVFSMQISDRFYDRKKELFTARKIEGLKPYTPDNHSKRVGIQMDDNKLITFSVGMFSFIVHDEFDDALEKGIMSKGEVKLQRRLNGSKLVPANITALKNVADTCEITLSLGFSGSVSDYSYQGSDRTVLDHPIRFYLDREAELLGNAEKRTLFYSFNAYGRRGIEMHFTTDADYYSMANFLNAVITAYSGKVTAVNGPSAKKGASLADVEAQAAQKKEEKDPMEELNSLVGMKQIKHDVEELISLVRMQKRREEKGMKAVPVNLHLVFTGNPGTGKTTVARILGKLYKQIGVLEKGQLVECDRSGLVAGYIGHTAIQTQKKIEEAIGGILFIDEAYTLAKEGNDFGQEAIDTLLKAMEDRRGEFVVIVAGYPDLMQKFINSNPGLKSRFNKYICFQDYSAGELKQIFDSNCKKYDYKMDEEAEKEITDTIVQLVETKDDNFANAREIRNLFETIITNQAARVDKIENPTEEDLITIRLADVLEK